jgi:hypothetical protein
MLYDRELAHAASEAMYRDDAPPAAVLLERVRDRVRSPMRISEAKKP